MSLSLSAFDTVCAARMAVYRRLPYFMKMLFKLAPVERPGCGTFFVDEKLRVHYDPEMALKWGVENCATFLAHEVQHPLREHLVRGSAWMERESGRWHALKPWLEQVHPMLGVSPSFFWNVVADIEINPTVIEVGFAFPDGFSPVFPETLKLRGGQFAEEYAEELFQRAEKLRKDQQQSARPKPGGKENGDATNSGSGGAQHGAGNEPGERRDDAGDGDGGPERDDTASAQVDNADAGGGAPAEPQDARPFEGSCGSCAAHRHSLEDTADEDEMPNGVSSAEVEVARRQVAHDTTEPTQEMQRLMDKFGIGNVPGSLKAWAKAQLTPPEVPWSRVLAPLVRNAVAYARGRVDWKFGRPSRRREMLKQTLGDSAPLLPTLESPVPHVGIVVDTSGSMQAKGATDRTMLDEALSEVAGIVLATGVPCWTAAVDAEVQEWVRVRDKRDVARLIKGCGGTDMRVGVKAAAERKFDVIVLVTDGYTPWPSRHDMPRKARLVVCCTTDAKVPDYIKPVVRVALGKKRGGAK